ncbi:MULTISPECIES: DNA-protecting protein DprA [Klebsiella]|uniref:DNA protecting protein DprA n=1 Tax=Klebsiella michiganensis TaxID=1134687 RepID=A0A7H5A2B9_9ENTR|nr:MULTISPECIES: DNA-protecting protein DprA [Klebsiella]EHS94644.1 DNA protecting protein DprA [Klebsiella michiganensis]EWF81150.1 DNA protecting protein DprA [Klebsiella michiganensis]MBE0136459.1 DNA-protecting protein DprA [Klebsiella michiganensis]MBE0205194.1 DNA-protecting protein DprA [Klebsiella michiganensis]MBX4647137.1 DNA-protecting protein DprA [Klebsiella michiganensis]
MTPREIWLRLMRVSSLYGESAISAARQLSSSATLGREDLRACGLSLAQSKHFLSVNQCEIDATLQWLERPNCYLLTAEDPLYPPQLRAIVDFPCALLVCGDPALLSSRQLSVIGSRAHSWYGARWGKLFSEALARYGITITSGLALGIDGIAHRGALEGKGKTVAVLGNGLREIYPRRHQALAEQITNSCGAIISEFPLFTPPLPGNFPRRNRIISGLSAGVLVIEAALKSGSLVTVRYALEQGRDVFALPGPIGSPGSEGPHWLIKQGAIPVTAPEDIVEYWRDELPYVLPEPDDANNCGNRPSVALPFPELLANVGDEVTPVDVVAERAGQSVPVTVAQLLELELAGWIAAVPGGYVRLRRASHVRRTDVSV